MEESKEAKEELCLSVLNIDGKNVSKDSFTTISVH